MLNHFHTVRSASHKGAKFMYMKIVEAPSEIDEVLKKINVGIDFHA